MTDQEKHELIARELEPPCGFVFVPHYSTDLQACAVIERIIGERGFGAAYACCLETVLHREALSLVDVFEFITASANDRVDAMLMLISDITANRNAGSAVAV